MLKIRVVLNPVRAKAVERPEDWRWSSYRGTNGMEKPHECLSREWILGHFGTKGKKAENKYREFVNAGIKGKGIWKEVRGQSVLGEGAFFEKLFVHVKAHEDITEIPRRQRYVSRPALSEIFADSKQLAKQIRKAVLDYGYSQREVAEFMGIHYSTISRRVNNTCHATNKT
jgi:putative transposase